jgi:hypothetical protein
MWMSAGDIFARARARRVNPDPMSPSALHMGGSRVTNHEGFLVCEFVPPTNRSICAAKTRVP